MADATERFLSKVEPVPEAGCWLWTAALGGNGYGVFSVDGKSVSAHRHSYEMRHGAIPGGKVICHKCDTRSCVNPDHLFAGSHTDNAVDASRKARGVIRGRQQISPEVAQRIRLRYRQGGISERALAAEVGVSRGCISAVLKGRSFAWLAS